MQATIMEAELPTTPESAMADPRTIPLSDISLSVRTANVLKNAGAAFLGDVASLTESTLLGFQNCGRKSVQEIREILAQHGLAFGDRGLWAMPVDQPVAPPKTLADYDETTRALLFLRVKDLNLSPRSNNAMTVADIEYVGELVQIAPAQLVRFQQCGRTSSEEIRTKLEKLGLSLGMEIVDWDRKLARTERLRESKLIDAARVAAQDVVIPDSNHLEDELDNFLKAFATGRNVEMVGKFLGWTGNGRRTLESVGQEFGITRERVRQIVAKTVRKIKAAPFGAPNVSRAADALRQIGPATPVELAKLLMAAGLAKGEFQPSGIASACEIFGVKFGLETRLIGNARIYGRPPALERLRSLFALCRRLTSSRGCANFDAMCDELEVPLAERDGARTLISKNGKFTWLDEERRWIFTRALSRNRLTNIVSKVLSVAPEIHLSELRRAAAKSKRLQVVPPAAVLARFLEATELATVSNDDVHTDRNFDGVIEKGSSEDTMIRVLNEHGPVLHWDKFQEYCIAGGMNPITVGIYLSISPVVARVARGVYALVGAKVDAGVAEEISAQSEKLRRPSEFGWTSRGTLWCAIAINRNTLTSGSVNLPSFVTSMVEGKEWRVGFGGRLFGTVLKARNNFLWSLAKPLADIGADPGDICILDFDLREQIVNLAVGGEELVDAWESGDIDILESRREEFSELAETDDAEEIDDDVGADISPDDESSVVPT